MLLSKALYFFYKTSYIYLLITFCGGSHKLFPSLSETWSVIHSWIIWVTHIWANWLGHYGDVIVDAIESQITSLTIIYSLVYSDVHQTKHQSSASLAFVRGIHRRPVNSPHKWPVTLKKFPFDDVIMWLAISNYGCCNTEHLFTKRTDVLPQDLVKTWSHEIRI